MEIKAIDFRIGNYFLDPFGEIKKVESIDDVGVNGYYDNSIGGTNFEFGGVFENIKPIPLTGEILLKSGFEIGEKRTYSKEIESLSFCVYIDGEKLELNSLILWQSDAVYFRGVLKYVHQLQNIYFSLIGEELEIKF